ncbi:hypothetical protein, partial [Enterococcus innesii]|uniref:hypothetical protein n=1 Tax=Enterococcus innesii TaxID=2839759 RepID=UPI003D0FA3B2
NDEILTRWNLEKILTNRVRGIDSNPYISIFSGASHFFIKKEFSQLKVRLIKLRQRNHSQFLMV